MDKVMAYVEKIIAVFKKIDLDNLLPQVDKLQDELQLVITVALLVGPVVMLFLGLWYFLTPPKEANPYAGFRTWFGMGSVRAWRATQKIAGAVWGSCGLVLSLVMWLISRSFHKLDAMQMADRAVTCLLWQIGVALVTYIGICVVVTILFDGSGRRRSEK